MLTWLDQGREGAHTFEWIGEARYNWFISSCPSEFYDMVAPEFGYERWREFFTVDIRVDWIRIWNIDLAIKLKVLSAP